MMANWYLSQQPYNRTISEYKHDMKKNNLTVIKSQDFKFSV